jgi:acyl carrier protein
MEDLDLKIKKVIADQIGKSASDIKDTDHFIDDLQMDSLDVVEVVMGIEETIGQEIPESNAVDIRTVKDAIAAVKSIIKD